MTVGIAGRVYHCNVTVGWAQWWQGRHPNESLFNGASPRESAVAIAEYAERGFKYVPACDNTDPKTGECLGHAK